MARCLPDCVAGNPRSMCCAGSWTRSAPGAAVSCLLPGQRAQARPRCWPRMRAWPRIAGSACSVAAGIRGPLGPILDAIVSADEPPVAPARLHELSQSPDQRFWLLLELQESLEKTAHRAPLLIIVDDLQWADPATASALVTLSRRLATHRIGWLLALRRGKLPDAARDAVGWRRCVRDPAWPPGQDRGRAGRPGHARRRAG